LDQATTKNNPFHFFGKIVKHFTKKQVAIHQTESEKIAKCPFHHGEPAKQQTNAGIPLTNYISGESIAFDAKHLSKKETYNIGVDSSICYGALMEKPQIPTVNPNRTASEVCKEAEDFLKEYYRDSIKGNWESSYYIRIASVKNDIEEKGYYFHTTEELEYGVQLAWRNSSRCIMRSQWQNIKVIDARGGFAEYGKEITADEIYNQCVEHLKSAVNIGKTGNKIIKSQITVFPQLLPGEKTGRRIWNSQLIRFAGYVQSDGNILGDPANVELTNTCLQLGWNPPINPTPFDVLPLLVQASDGGEILLKELPEDAKLLVPITHPNFPEFDKLGIYWHAIPALSSFCLDIGGIQYTAAPFNGWYMGPEIGSRNLGDVQRYNLMPAMAKAMGLYTTSNRSLWKDRAMVELNAAVLHSFDVAGITIQDHQSASNAFVKHHKAEMETRGFIPADWVWITPPLGGSANAVFHQEMIDFFIKPNFIASNVSLKDLK
jgi:nitric oxide synthase oxygenase domain/subunit